MAESQKIGVDAANQTRQQDREDVKTVADIEARQADQAMSAEDRQRQAIESERNAAMGERQQSFTEQKAEASDRNSVVEGKRVAGRVDIGGRRRVKDKKNITGRGRQ